MNIGLENVKTFKVDKELKKIVPINQEKVVSVK